MTGLIKQEILHLRRVKALTPNVRAVWGMEENERDFVAWCRKDIPTGLVGPLENVDMKKPWTRYILGEIRNLRP